MNRYRFALFALTGLFSGLAAVLLTSRLGSTRPSIAQGWELEIISMVILGGVSVWGGKGSILGVVLAALVFGLVTFGLGLMNIPGIVMSIFIGRLLILVVAVPALVEAPMSDQPLIAVFDVGKTNAKLALVDPALGQEIWSARRANERRARRRPGRELDVVRHRGVAARSRCARRRERERDRRDRADRAWRGGGARRSRGRSDGRARLRRRRASTKCADEYARAARPLLADVFAAPAAGSQSRPAALLPADSAAPSCSSAPRTS